MALGKTSTAQCFFIKIITSFIGRAGKASGRSKRQAPISAETILISDSEKEPTPPPKSTPMTQKSYVAMLMGGHTLRSVRSKWNRETSNDSNQHAVQFQDEMVVEKGRQVVRAAPLTLKKNRSRFEDKSAKYMSLQHVLNCRIDHSSVSPSPKKWSKVVIISFNEENDDSESEVCGEDEPAIDFIQRQRDKNPMFALMANLTDQRNQLDHEMERITMQSLQKKRFVKDFIDNEAEEVHEDVDDGCIFEAEIMQHHSGDVMVSHTSCVNRVSNTSKATIEDKDEHKDREIGKPGKKVIKPQSVHKELVFEFMVNIEVERNKTPLVSLDQSMCNNSLKDTYANIPYTLKVLVDGIMLTPISMTDALRITKTLVYIRAVCMTFGIVQKSYLMKPHTFTSPVKEEMQIKELDIVPICQEWELAQGFYDGDGTMAKNVQFNAYGNVAFSTHISHVDSNNIPSGYSARLKKLLGESATSPRKAKLFMPSSSSEVLPLFPKPTPANLMVGDRIPVFDCTDYFQHTA
ncbi:uncharacterized protein LAESUDRAFT_717590 [Laetiporus sulphureus 93-53]|uniref:Uncharacterized protein n=1 Tax=Laetiporus sulphureus 93-53 TaxID=1314785 RepID=A0A165BLG9_9APHY|nr:uncharacterized protein LAESUDRAFT_717590 [Laetiporus sulphureus 93-53]KZT01271.1 hypothetical protein LAESUDRAFT_717590 [Laetiporus sulphureus 93-53]